MPPSVFPIAVLYTYLCDSGNLAGTASMVHQVDGMTHTCGPGELLTRLHTYCIKDNSEKQVTGPYGDVQPSGNSLNPPSGHS